MLIPNYDNLIDKKKNNFNQLYNYMLSKSCRMLICGPSGSGKTNAVVHMLLKPLIYYDKIYFADLRIFSLFFGCHNKT